MNPVKLLSRGANKANAGLLLDIWHLSRGNVDFKEIATIKPEFIKGIELDDADRYAIEPLWMDTCHKRRLPGEGVLDVQGFIKAVHLPTTDGRELILSRYTQPEPEHRLLLDHLRLTLPAEPPPKITARPLPVAATRTHAL
ncbi:hypothetical protein OKW40_005742 [Paraburkholderia sp. RAU6.4a]|uniref:hypothetical protein n=1 Tax=Paraburkholderia sp. RAU6.4a TaxID=2991067 RepID=UPI003D1C085F